MKQLSWMDHAFFLFETPRTPSQIGMVLLCDPSTAPEGRVTFDDVTRLFRERLPLVGILRRRAVFVPLDLDQAYWLEDPNFDLDYHLRHIALPKPGDWRQFCVQVARLHSRPLDLTRPPWECTMIEGLDRIDGVRAGSFALSLKIHHAAVDGMAGAELVTVISDQTADATSPLIEDTWRPDLPPSSWSLLARAGVHAVTRPIGAMRVATANLAPVVLERWERRDQRPGRVGSVPRTRFNGKVSAHRTFDAVRFPLEIMRGIKAAVPGATVNDALLAYVGGGLLRYLDAKGEHPATSLVATVPISTRRPEQRPGEGNEITMMQVPMHTHIDDPLARLTAIYGSTSASKAAQHGVAAETLREMSQAIPGALLGVAMRTFAALPQGGPLVSNTLVTNVPGPKQPLYIAGARVDWTTGMAPLLDGAGLVHAAASYIDDFLCQITADRDQLPDIEFYMECLNDSLEELKTLTKRAPTKRAPTKRAAKGARSVR